MPQLTAQANTIDRAAAATDSVLAVRHRTDSLRLAEAAHWTAAARHRAESLGDTAARLSSSPVPLAPDSCAIRLKALGDVVLRLVPASEAALDSAAAEIRLLQVTMAARDSTIDTARAQRDEARRLVRQALGVARPWPTWRKLLASVSCAATGWLAGRSDRTPSLVTSAACVLSVAL